MLQMSVYVLYADTDLTNPNFCQKQLNLSLAHRNFIWKYHGNPPTVFLHTLHTSTQRQLQNTEVNAAENSTFEVRRDLDISMDDWRLAVVQLSNRFTYITEHSQYIRLTQAAKWLTLNHVRYQPTYIRYNSQKNININL